MLVNAYASVGYAGVGYKPGCRGNSRCVLLFLVDRRFGHV
ncbi:MAG: hypothetical protein AVDCRST_MAG75-2151 [uncultured Propionibacteriaceae bacterium]|uniref:Uncharacterized protein n=1 Tax=uncultured Propionibacteriaceae bacterium TaxID=257457 RepID=A0A6J4NYA5_9ACTN|nr:MAG: hypothetical protein AVDCRST_MAG75-2151 [uncultured Propionibacteriaceae bacterium]